jgi:hypothetical protein
LANANLPERSGHVKAVEPSARFASVNLADVECQNVYAEEPAMTTYAWPEVDWEQLRRDRRGRGSLRRLTKTSLTL